MPIVIDKNIDPSELKTINIAADTKDTSAKLFHDDLTGVGLKSGLFNDKNDTIHDVFANTVRSLQTLNESTAELDMLVNNQLNYTKKEKQKELEFNHYARVLTTPVLPALFSETNGLQFIVPSNTTLFNIMNYKRWTQVHYENNVVTTVKPIVQQVSLHEKDVRTASAGNKYQGQKATEVIVYLAMISYTVDVNADAHVYIGGIRPTKDQISMTVKPLYATSHLGGLDEQIVLEQLEKHFIASKQTTLGMNTGIKTREILEDKFIATVGELSISNALNSQSKTTYYQLEDQIDTAFNAFVNCADDATGTDFEEYAHKLITNHLSMSIQIMDHIGDIDTSLLPTDFLSRVFDIINNSTLSDHYKDYIIQNSLRLVLSQRSNQLKQIKDAGELYEFKTPDDAITQAYKTATDISTEQKRIVLSTDPLIIGQAGAGSGKSHTVKKRLNYMEEQGEDLSKALVLSFTNVAANNIKNRFPNIRSQTLANMFNRIYEKTYPHQKLSQPTTVSNSILMLDLKSKYFVNQGYGTDEFETFIRQFAQTLDQLDQSGYKKVNVQLVTKTLGLMIQKDSKAIEIVLNAIEQVTLELQPIIIHHHLMHSHDQLNVPKEYQDLNFIITDESQDISTFEYILLLELTIHHKSQLLIVGDGSQTLYEFRNSDPKYMNALEASGVFTNHKLDVNFRSNSEVLTFANQFLDVIEANDVAKIQLKSQIYKTPSAKSFEQAITVQNISQSSGKGNEYVETLKENILENNDFQDWFLTKMRNNEQVAFLGWTRIEVTAMMEAVEELLNHHNLKIEAKSIMSDNERPQTILSRTLRNIHHVYVTLDPRTNDFRKDLFNLVETSIIQLHRKASPKQLAFFKSKVKEELDKVMSTHQYRIMVQECIQGKIDPKAVRGHILKESLRREQMQNNMKQYLQKDKDPVDYSNEKLLFSTIHGAKGLEFDHVVLSYNESKRGAKSQEALRMLFVALSRAKQSEYIMNVHTGAGYKSSDTLSAMFQTPMQTAYMRSLNYIDDQTKTLIAP